MSLLQMSFSGAILILIIIIARALLIDKLPKRTFLALWMVALVRLLVPFSFPSIASIYTLVQTNTPAVETVNKTPIRQFLPIHLPEQMQTNMQEQPVIPIRTASPVNGWIIIWAAGAFLCIAFFVVTYVRYYREFQMSIPVDNEIVRRWYHNHPSKRRIIIRQSDMISAPLSYGIVHPVILMPKSTKWEETAQLSYVLEHEYVHIRRLDAVTKQVVIAALSLHWFNPFVWILYFLLNRDIELSCDEAVVRRFGENMKSAYAMTLINLEEKKSGLTPFCNSFSKNAIEERIRSIMKIRKVSFVTSILAAVLVIGIASTFATSAATSETDFKFASKFDGSRIGNESQLILNYKLLNKTDSQDLKLEVGDILKFDVVSLAGSVDISLQKEDKEPEYAWLSIPTSTSQIEIDESGIYTVSVTGKKARGRVNITVEKQQTRETKEIDIEDSKESEGVADDYLLEQTNRTSEDSKDHERIRDLVYHISRNEQFPEYEKFGISYDGDNGYLIYDGKTVGYFKDEIKPGFYTRYSDGTGELGVVVIRNEAGEIIALQVDQAEKVLNAQPVPFVYKEE